MYHPYDDSGRIQVEAGDAPEIDAELPVLRERELELCTQEQLDRRRMCRDQYASPIMPSQQMAPGVFDAGPEVGHTFAGVGTTRPGIGEAATRLAYVPGDKLVVGQAG
jgi:hypothetical protein